MKKCTVGLFSRIVTVLLFAAFFLPMTVLFLYLAFLAPALPREERLLFAAGAVLFGGLVAFAAYRGLCQGVGWAEYDAETVIFHCSRREQHRFRWEEIPGDRVQAGPWQGGYLFVIRSGKRRYKVGLSRFSAGFRDFERTLGAVGVLRRIGVAAEGDLRQSAEQVWTQFEAYREAHPGAVRPKPEGDCVPCPDCAGRGIFPKRVLNLDIGKVCRTCGGSGYVPRRR